MGTASKYDGHKRLVAKGYEMAVWINIKENRTKSP
jgi:hypothetical protein